MTYPNDLTLVQLAEHYEAFNDKSCLEELRRRDELNKMGHKVVVELSCDGQMALSTNEEPDNQLVFDFYKQVDSAAKTTNNSSVEDDQWKEGYEIGHRIGFERGLREGLPGIEDKEDAES